MKFKVYKPIFYDGVFQGWKVYEAGGAFGLRWVGYIWKKGAA